MLACKARKIGRVQVAALNLVGIEFCPGEAPDGCARLLFADGGALSLDLECLERELTDMGEDDAGAGEH